MSIREMVTAPMHDDFDLHQWFREGELEQCPECGEVFGVRLPTGSFLCLGCGHLRTGEGQPAVSPDSDTRLDKDTLRPAVDRRLPRARCSERLPGPSDERSEMANPVPAGSDVSAGTYRCTNCGHEMDVGSSTHLPPCPSCGNGEWETVTGVDSVNDPDPNR